MNHNITPEEFNMIVRSVMVNRAISVQRVQQFKKDMETSPYPDMIKKVIAEYEKDIRHADRVLQKLKERGYDGN